jgi:hypothetical protein
MIALADHGQETTVAKQPQGQRTIADLSVPAVHLAALPTTVLLPLRRWARNRQLLHSTSEARFTLSYSSGIRPDGTGASWTFRN